MRKNLVLGALLSSAACFRAYPLRTIENREHYYAKAVPEKWLTVFTHGADVPWAYVEKDELGKMVAREA
jgi:hypothetical protein